jgi:penicillin amidase
MRSDWAKWGVAAFAAIAAALTAIAYFGLRASLPRRDGEVQVAGLSAPAAIGLDAHAIPKIEAASYEDALRGQGYMHAQERFFEMDLFRRASAGELAALVGERALALDRAQRPFDLRARSRALLERLPAEQRGWLEAYTQGVNAGLADLGARPPEYWLLGRRPEPWRPEDSVLVVYTFYKELSNNEAYELPQGVMHAVLPPALYAFLTPSTSRFDRPLIGAGPAPGAATGGAAPATDGLDAPPTDLTGGYARLPVPGPDVIDLRQFSHLPARRGLPRVDPPQLGPASNQWAVDATRGARGNAILANDPHLALRLPSTFYRAELYWPGHVARGVGIPGAPGILIGASGTLAWGATVSNADQSDWVVVEVDPKDPARYLTPEGSEPFGTATWPIAIAGRAPEHLEARTTRWGPIAAHDWRGRPLALHAAWLEPDGLNLDVLALPNARDVGEGIAVLETWAGPSLNWMLADSSGRIGWVVNGPLPRRVGFDGSRPESWADGKHAWSGENARPKSYGRTDGALFTANNRTLPAEHAAELGRMWMRPLRAARIDDLLAAKRTLGEADFLAMQLDTRAAGYDLIRDVLLEVVAADDREPLLARAREQVARWNGRADTDQVGFRILHLYYRALLERVLAPLLGEAGKADPSFVYRWPLADEPLRRVLEERPAYLLTKDFANWPTFLRQVLLDALREVDEDPRRAGAGATWGEVNVLDVAHPFAALPVIGPALARWLKLPAAPLPGSTLSLRVAAPAYGALVRMSVTPAHPEDGILEMSGGQSGHFLSANFADLQSAWLEGAPAPFLAGAVVRRIRLVSAAQR